MTRIINRLETKSCSHLKKSKDIKTTNKKSGRNTNTNKKEISKIELKIKEFDRMKKEF